MQPLQVASGERISGEPATQSDDPSDPPSGRLCILRHAVHKIAKLANGSDELVVSTLRPFQVTLGLFSPDDLTIVEHEVIQLEASLLFEDGQPVPTPLPGHQAIDGQFSLLSGGQAIFKIKLNVLSSQSHGKRFRIRFSEVATANQVPRVKGVISDPMRTITKLYRSPPRNPLDSRVPNGRTSPRTCELQDAKPQENLAAAMLREQVKQQDVVITELEEENRRLTDKLKRARAEYENMMHAKHDHQDPQGDYDRLSAYEADLRVPVKHQARVAIWCE